MHHIADFQKCGELGRPSPPAPCSGDCGAIADPHKPKGEGRKANLSSRTQTRSTLPRMHPALRPYYDHVIPVFWPWLWLNLVRFALWHLRTGHEALLAVDCFGNIRMVFTADEPKPDNLYTYEAPLMPRWEHPALSSALPVSAPAFGYSAFIASLCRAYTVFYVVRERVRGPPIQHPPPHAERSRSISAG